MGPHEWDFRGIRRHSRPIDTESDGPPALVPQAAARARARAGRRPPDPSRRAGLPLADPVLPAHADRGRPPAARGLDRPGLDRRPAGHLADPAVTGLFPGTPVRQPIVGSDANRRAERVITTVPKQAITELT